MIFVPITGKPLHHLDFIYQLQASTDKTGMDIVKLGHTIQKKYELCVGGPNVVENYEKQFIKNASSFVVNGLTNIMEELDLSHNRKIASILVDKLLDNNESASTK
tara:strand:+ start:670 stop:984 length:315 start_codon:yes stop_codon:yes gene_type:complete